MLKNNPSLCSFSLRLIFFSEKPFYGNYSTLSVSFSYKCCNFSGIEAPEFSCINQARNQDFMWGGANEAKVDQTTEMYFLLSDPFI